MRYIHRPARHQDYCITSDETLQLRPVANFVHLWYNSLGAYEYMNIFEAERTTLAGGSLSLIAHSSLHSNAWSTTSWGSG